MPVSIIYIKTIRRSKAESNPRPMHRNTNDDTSRHQFFEGPIGWYRCNMSYKRLNGFATKGIRSKTFLHKSWRPSSSASSMPRRLSPYLNFIRQVLNPLPLGHHAYTGFRAICSTERPLNIVSNPPFVRRRKVGRIWRPDSPWWLFSLTISLQPAYAGEERVWVSRGMRGNLSCNSVCTRQTRASDQPFLSA